MGGISTIFKYFPCVLLTVKTKRNRSKKYLYITADTRAAPSRFNIIINRIRSNVSDRFTSFFYYLAIELSRLFSRSVRKNRYPSSFPRTFSGVKLHGNIEKLIRLLLDVGTWNPQHFRWFNSVLIEACRSSAGVGGQTNLPNTDCVTGLDTQTVGVKSARVPMTMMVLIWWRSISRRPAQLKVNSPRSVRVAQVCCSRVTQFWWLSRTDLSID